MTDRKRLTGYESENNLTNTFKCLTKLELDDFAAKAGQCLQNILDGLEDVCESPAEALRFIKENISPLSQKELEILISLGGELLYEDEGGLEDMQKDVQSLAQKQGDWTEDEKALPYLAAELFYIEQKRGKTSPLADKVAEAVGSMSKEDYGNPQKLAGVLDSVLEDHLVSSFTAPKPNTPRNPFARK